MWFKHDRDFLKRLWPTKPPTIRQHLVWLAMLAWEEQGIVKDFAYLSWLSGIPLETLETIWPDYETASLERDNRWMPAEMWQAFDSYEAKVEQASNAGKVSADRRLNAGSTKGSTLARRSLIGRSTDKDKNKNISSGNSIELPGADAPAQGKPPEISGDSKKQNPYYLTFSQQFQSTYQLPYLSKKGDFVQFAQLKQKIPGGLNLEDWQIAVANYLATPQGEHTLADLAAHYVSFRRSARNEFNKPVAPLNGHSPPKAKARCGKCNGRGDYLDGRKVRVTCDCPAGREMAAMA